MEIKSVEIRVVANGYWLGPTMNGRCNDYDIAESIYVFESFDALVAFLKEKLVKPGEKT